jgi:AbrB family looped-hinge helix DNA binding protein
MSLMVATVKIDKYGRIVLPRAVRDQLRLSPGDSLHMDCSKGRAVLRPARGVRIYKKQGVWVLNSGEPLDVEVVNRTLRRVRAERDRRNLGNFR